MNSTTRHVLDQGRTIHLSANEQLTSDHLVVCIHGLGCSKQAFDRLFTAPNLNGFSICAVDLPGHGGTQSPDGFESGMDDYARVVASLIHQLEPAGVSVVAHSMGGAVGVLLTRHGIKIDRFVSIEGNLVAQDCGYASRMMAGQSLQEFLEHGYLDFVTSLESSERTDLRTWSRWLRGASPKAVHEGAKSLVEWSDCGELLRLFNRLDNKTYVYGDLDKKEFLLPHLLDAGVIPIANSGHFCMLDSPIAFCEAVTNGLRRS